MRIVLADNDPEVLDLLSSDLTAAGHDIVASVLQGDEATRICEREQPDVLVVDYRMPPGPNGIDVAVAVRDASPGTAIIVYTNYRDSSLRKRAEAVGARVLPKGNIRALRRAVAAQTGRD